MADTPSRATASTLSIFGRKPSDAITLPLRLCPALLALSMQLSIAPILSCCPVPIANDNPSFQKTTALDLTSQATHHACNRSTYSLLEGARFVGMARLFNCSNDLDQSNMDLQAPAIHPPAR